MTAKMYVGNLSWKAQETDLTDLFSKHGTVVSAKIITDRDSGESKGFGFVEMETPEEAKAAISHFESGETEHMGRVLRVNEAEDRRK